MKVNQNIKKQFKILGAIKSMWKVIEMSQIDVTRFPRWREVGLTGISLQVNILIRH